MLTPQKFKAAAVQAAPVFLDTDATVDKVCALIGEAAAEGAQLIAFPEVFVSAYPYWNWVMNPVEGSPWFEKLCRSAIEVPGPEIRKIAAAAARHRVNVVVGVNERNPRGIGTLYNTLVTIADDGRLLGRHRKLVPTWAEKLTWAPGDASDLRVHHTSIGPLGALACGENTNTLARFSLLAQGELVHVASYIALPVAPADYDMAEAIRLRAAAHSFEGKVFTIVSCSTISPQIISAMADTHPNAADMLSRRSSAFSGILGPDGRVIGEPLIDVEGIVYADIDLAKCIQPRQMHDITGHYNRFDIFDLRVDRRALVAARFRDDDVPHTLDANEAESGQVDAPVADEPRRSRQPPARLVRIGQIVPSSNTTMETEIPAMLRLREAVAPERFSFHSSRMRMKRVVKEELEAMDRDSDRCALELSDARVDALAYACLVAIMSMGPGYHRTSQERLGLRTVENGAPAPVVTSAGALVDGLHAMGMKRIAVVCPYMKPLTRLVVEYLENEGIEVKDYLALEIPDNLKVAAQDPFELKNIYKRLDLRNVDGLVLSACVQMRSLPAIAAVEAESGVRTLSAAVATTWQMLQKLGLTTRIPNCGELLSGKY